LWIGKKDKGEKMVSQKWFRTLAILLVVVMFVTACAPAAPTTSEAPKPAEPSKAPEAAKPAEPTKAPEAAKPADTAVAPATGEPKVLVMATEGSAPTFDPLGSSDSRVDTPSINMYNTLTQSKPGTTEIMPELADSYEMAKDGLSATFKLKKGVKFHDGSELKAADVKYTVDRMLALKKGYYQSLVPIVGADVVDDYTVTLKVSAPFPGMIMALSRLYILNSTLVKKNEASGDWGEKWLQDHEAGSGPYKLVSFEPEQQFTMEKFPDYFKGWNGSHADRVIFRVFKEEATRRLALENKDVDWALVYGADTFNALKKDTGITTYTDATLNQLYFAFNFENKYLKDVRIRKALALAYDYKGHVEQARSGYASIAKGPLPPAIPCFDDSMKESETNLDAAKKLMAEAGYEKGGFELNMAYQGTMAEEVSAFQIMQAGLQELGITLKAMPVEWPAKVAAYSNKDTAPAIGTIWIYPSYPDPDEFLYLLASSSQVGGGGLNFAWYKSDKMDEYLNKGKSELDPVKRCEYYKQAQKLWVEDRPYADVVVGTALSASRDYVKGFVWTPSHSFAQDVYQMSVDGKYTK
jgi:peptide/nickel transport system substrate-binding protein